MKDRLCYVQECMVSDQHVKGVYLDLASIYISDHKDVDTPFLNALMAHFPIQVPP